MEFKWVCIMFGVIVVAVSVSDIFTSKAKEQTKQAAIQAIEKGAAAETVNRILNR